MADVSTEPMELLLEEVSACAACLRQRVRSSRASMNVSMPQQAVLRLVRQHPGGTVPQLARRRGSSRQSVQVIVDRLAAAGFVRCVANPDHRRSKGLQLTESGVRVLGAANRRQAARITRLLSGVTAEEIGTCLATLQRVRVGLSDGQSVPTWRAAPRRKQAAPTQDFKPEVSTASGAQPMEVSMGGASPPDELPVSLL